MHMPHTFSDLQGTSALRMGDSVVCFDHRDRHAVRRPRRISDRDGISRRGRWEDTGGGLSRVSMCLDCGCYLDRPKGRQGR